MRVIARWVTALVAVIAGLIALFAVNAWRQTAWLPYNTEGRYFDGVTVTFGWEPQLWALIGCTAVAITAGAGFALWKLRQR
jgi:hypothetical protein